MNLCCSSSELFGHKFELVLDSACHSLSVFTPFVSLLMKSCHATIAKTVVLKTLNNWAVEVTDTPAEQAPMIYAFWTSPISPTTCNETAEYDL